MNANKDNKRFFNASIGTDVFYSSSTHVSVHVFSFFHALFIHPNELKSFENNFKCILKLTMYPWENLGRNICECCKRACKNNRWSCHRKLKPRIAFNDPCMFWVVKCFLKTINCFNLIQKHAIIKPWNIKLKHVTSGFLSCNEEVCTTTKHQTSPYSYPIRCIEIYNSAW